MVASGRESNLMLIDDKKAWQRSLDAYNDVLSLISEQKVNKSKGKVKKEDTLVHLDKW